MHSNDIGEEVSTCDIDIDVCDINIDGCREGDADVIGINQDTVAFTLTGVHLRHDRLHYTALH